VHWDSNYTDSCLRTSGPSDFTTGGATTGGDQINVSGTPGFPTTYRLQCGKDGNNVNADVDLITINVNLLKPTLTPSQSVVRVGQPITLEWDTNNSLIPGGETLCSLSGPGISGNPLTAGGGGDAETGETDPITITGRSTFTLTCPQGTAIRTIDVIPEGGET
jgi:hypothetical protein